MPTQLQFRLEFDPALVEITRLPSGYDRIRVEGLPVLSGPDFYGMPALPSRSELVLLPPDMKVVSLRATLEAPYVFEGEIVPEYVVPDDPSGEDEWADAGPDSVIYNGWEPFPPFEEDLASQGSYRGFQLARAAVFPFMYIGALKQLTLFTSVELTVELAPRVGVELPVPRLRPDRLLSRERFELRWLREVVFNPEEIDPLYGYLWGGRFHQQLSVQEERPDAGFSPTEIPSLQGSPVDCVILTDSVSVYGVHLGDIVAAWQRWADWKTEKGTPTVIRTVGWVQEHYPASDIPESIRAFLREAYSLWGTDWVIVGGDHEVVPGRWTTTDDDATSWSISMLERDAAPLYYYSELDSDWNHDDDGIYGDTQADREALVTYPDLWIGRIPARDSTEAAGIIDKLVAYCRTPDYHGPAPQTDYYTRLLVAAGFTNDAGNDWWNGIKNGEDVVDTLTAYSWAYDRYYPVLPGYEDCEGQQKSCYYITKNTVVADWTGVNDFRWDAVRNALNADRYQSFFHFEHSARWLLGGPYIDDEWFDHIGPPETECGIDPQCSTVGDPSPCLLWRQACYAAYQNLNLGPNHITREQVLDLTNAPHYGIWVTVGSGSSSDDQDAVSEASIRNPGGGAIAYVGRYMSARTYGIAEDRSVQRELVYKVFRDGIPLGTALAEAASQCDAYPSPFYPVLDWHLLGDPEVRGWTEAPDTLVVDVTFEPLGYVGLHRITVTVKDIDGVSILPVPGAVVCASQGTKFWARTDTGADGKAVFPQALLAEEDSVTVTVTKPDFLPWRERYYNLLWLDPGSLVYQHHVWADTADTATTPDILEPGDTVDIEVSLKNVGQGFALVSVEDSVYVATSAGMQVTLEFDATYMPDRIRLGSQSGSGFPHPPDFAPTFNLPLHEYGISMLTAGPPLPELGVSACYFWRDPGSDYTYHLKTYWYGNDTSVNTMTGELIIDGGIADLAMTIEQGVDSVDLLDFSPSDPDTLVLIFQKDRTADEVTFRADFPRWIVWHDRADVFTAGSYASGDTANLEYRFSVKPGFEDLQPLSFVMSWLAGSAPSYVRHFAEFQTTVHAPDVRLLYQEVDMIQLGCQGHPTYLWLKTRPRLVNLGTVAADSLTFRTGIYAGEGEILQDQGTLDRLDPGEVEAISADLEFCVNEDNFLYSWEVTGPVAGEQTVFYAQEQGVKLTVPGNVVVTGVEAQPVPEGIRVLWDPVAGADPQQFAGYVVLEDNNGTAEVVTRVPIEGVCRQIVYEPPAVDANNQFIPYDFGVSVEYRSGSLGPIVWAETCYANPPEVAGWPQKVAKGGVNSLVVYDVDADGTLEVFASGKVISAYRHDGSPLVGASGTLFDPQATNVEPFFLTELAVGRLDPSPQGPPPAVVAAHRNGWLYAINVSNGQLYWSKEIAAGGQGAGPVLADLDQDGTLECIIPVDRNPATLYAYKHDGAPYRPNSSGIFVEQPEGGEFWPDATVAAADLIPGNGKLEVVYGGDCGLVYCWEGVQPAMPSASLYHWRTTVCNIGADCSQCDPLIGTPSIGDIEAGYGSKEVALARAGWDEILVLNGQQGGTCNTWHTHRWHLHVYNHANEDSLLFATADNSPPISRIALADLGGPPGSSDLELIIPTERSGLRPQPMGRHDVVLASIFDNPTDCPEDLNWTLCTDWLPAEWRWSGPLPGRGPSPVVVDLDRDGTKEILLASPVGAVLIWEAGYQDGFTCEPKLAWPFRLVDAATTPVVADIDGDDCLEMAIGDEAGYVHLFELPGLAVCDPPSLEEMPWPMACANPHRTGEHGSFVGFRQEGEPEVAGLTVSPPSPNPFNPVVHLRYQLPYPARVRVAIYETTGRETAVLYEGPADAGSHDLLWDGRDGSGHPVASGVYLARVELGDYRMTQKVTLLK